MYFIPHGSDLDGSRFSGEGTERSGEAVNRRNESPNEAGEARIVRVQRADASNEVGG